MGIICEKQHKKIKIKNHPQIIPDNYPIRTMIYTKHNLLKKITLINLFTTFIIVISFKH